MDHAFTLIVVFLSAIMPSAIILIVILLSAFMTSVPLWPVCLYDQCAIVLIVYFWASFCIVSLVWMSFRRLFKQFLFSEEQPGKGFCFFDKKNFFQHFFFSKWFKAPNSLGLYFKPFLRL